nr:MAG TPA: Terminase [Caudoviricetes sp.]
MVCHCEDKVSRREWLLYVRAEARKLRSADAYELIRKTYVLGAQDGRFDDYCIALEWYRSPEKRFYLPRRSVLKPLVDDLQDLFDGKLDFLGVSLPPRVGKSTLCIFFMTFIMGHRPAAASVMSGHSDKLTDGFYRELLSIITDDTQYRWHDVFPAVQLVDNSAKNETIDLERKKRFPTMTCRSISGTLTGAVEIGTGGVLYCDDLIEDLEESLNPVRLQNKYDAYLNQLKDRKKLGAVELMVGTRWNVADPLGRIEEQYRDNPRYRFTVLPALNENGESNFNYKYDLGFDTEYYLDMKESIDDTTWMAKYMGNPYIREGLLFPADELRYYNGVLPDGEPDRIMAVVDTAWGGGDSLSMPVAYIYGEDVFIADVVFNAGDKTVTRPLVIGTLKKHHPHMVRWESNNGGDEYGGIVDEKLRQDGVRVNMSYKKAPTNQSKLSRIIQFAPDIKKFYFIDAKHRSAEYEKFMRELTLFTVSGKNLHDDAPDACAMLVDFITGGIKAVTVARRPF